MPARISRSLEHSLTASTRTLIDFCLLSIALMSINGRRSQFLRVLLPIGVRFLSRHEKSEMLSPVVSGMSSRFFCAAASRLIVSSVINGEILSTLFSELNCVELRYSRAAQAVPTHGSRSSIPKPESLLTLSAALSLPAEFSTLKFSGELG